MKRFIPLIMLLSSSAFAEGDFSLLAFTRSYREPAFCVRNDLTENTGWYFVGDSVAGWTVTVWSADTRTLTLQRGEETQRVVLSPSGSPVDKRDEQIDDLISERDIVEKRLSEATAKLEKEGWYSIRAGDTIAKMAAMWGTDVPTLLAANPAVDPRKLVVGQFIKKTGRKAAEPGATDNPGDAQRN